MFQLKLDQKMTKLPKEVCEELNGILAVEVPDYDFLFDQVARLADALTTNRKVKSLFVVKGEFSADGEPSAKREQQEKWRHFVDRDILWTLFTGNGRGDYIVYMDIPKAAA